MSSMVPIRPSGICAINSRVTCSGIPRVISVSMKPGATALTVICCLANSRAATFVSAINPALLAAYRRQVHNPPAGAQEVRGLLDAIERAGEVDAQHALPLVSRHFPDGVIAQNPGVVDERVQPAELVLYRSHHRRNLFAVGDIAWEDRGCPDFGRHTLGVRLVAPVRVGHVIHHAARPEPGERSHDARTNATRTAGDQHRFAGKVEGIVHVTNTPPPAILIIAPDRPAG